MQCDVPPPFPKRIDSQVPRNREQPSANRASPCQSLRSPNYLNKGVLEQVFCLGADLVTQVRKYRATVLLIDLLDVVHASIRLKDMSYGVSN